MSKTVRKWLIGGLVVGILVGLLLGWLFTSSALSGNAETPYQTFVGWVVISIIGSVLFFGLWGYANEQHQKVRRPDLFK